MNKHKAKLEGLKRRQRRVRGMIFKVKHLVEIVEE